MGHSLKGKIVKTIGKLDNLTTVKEKWSLLYRRRARGPKERNLRLEVIFLFTVVYRLSVETEIFYVESNAIVA